MDKQRGVVRKLREGYGFIAGNDGVDYFLHWTQMCKSTEESPNKTFRQLEVGDRVEYQSIVADKGPKALECQVL